MKNFADIIGLVICLMAIAYIQDKNYTLLYYYPLFNILFITVSFYIIYRILKRLEIQPNIEDQEEYLFEKRKIK